MITDLGTVAPLNEELSTAETLVLETLTTHIRLGAECWVFDRRLWVKPWLESLQERGLVTWAFDENADFVVRPTTALRVASNTINISKTTPVSPYAALVSID